ncbi:hypothetical protein RhiirA4_546759 [Rhizophagus irregularis]|uniref:Uncharacterized protein n=1 Tax=Rhizophagus irregularis TaxID=588596 RepID=A0A2I1GYU8_9GLOM|nr:hypothetical protein RhiirA4_546759 [Rhizophagus irregularis]
MIILVIEEQEAFHSKTYDFSIPDNIEDFNNSNDQKINKTSKINSIFKGGSKRLSKVFKRLQISSKNDIPIDHKKETMQQMKGSVNDDDKYSYLESLLESLLLSDEPVAIPTAPIVEFNDLFSSK